jgi:hypothetical protein
LPSGRLSLSLLPESSFELLKALLQRFYVALVAARIGELERLVEMGFALLLLPVLKQAQGIIEVRLREIRMLAEKKLKFGNRVLPVSELEQNYRVMHPRGVVARIDPHGFLSVFFGFIQKASLIEHLG